MTDAEIRQQKLDQLEECVQVRLQPKRIVLWALDGSGATTIETLPEAMSDADAQARRRRAIDERMAEFDEFWARDVQHQGDRRQPGRPPLPDDVRRDNTVRARVTAAEAEKFELLGGAEWLRAALKRARLP